MIDARRWRALVFCGCCLVGLTSIASAAPALTARADEANPSLTRVEVALSGEAGQDTLLFERIRSLFAAPTNVVRSDEQPFDQRAVLSPPRSDTVYIWIRVTESSRARVYLTLAERGEPARYLFREITLDAGLDEVAAQTLAEVAHSSARALWLREQQSSQTTLLDALERDTTPPPTLTAGLSPRPAIAPAAPVRDASASEQRPPRQVRSLRLGIGASATTHSSASEGWLPEVGAFLAAEHRNGFSLRAAARYLVATDFGVPPARVHLSGFSGELRAGWLTTRATQIRVRFEAGLGVLLGNARATIAFEEPRAHALAARDFRRGYALGAVGLEWPIGPIWVAASTDLRVALATTSYEVAGQTGGRRSATLCPGGSLEVGFGFDPAWR